MDREELLVTWCVVAFIVSICAMCAMFALCFSGVCDAQNWAVQLVIFSPALVFCAILWLLEYEGQINSNEKQ